MPALFSATRSTDAPADGRADFDPLFGRWNVHHRRLQKRLEGDINWDEFAGRCEMRPLMDGMGNVDDNVLELPGGAYRAAAVRTFDPATKLWAMWWIDGRNPPAIDIPVRGSFQDGVGTFLCDDVFNGQPIKVRFMWSEITENSARWQQAFSPDGGETWETTGTCGSPARNEDGLLMATGEVLTAYKSSPGTKASKAAKNCSR